MHTEQIEYCQKIANQYPEHFKNKTVLDVGSQDINGNNRYLFTDCTYLGLDIGPGKNVDIVKPVHIFYNDEALKCKNTDNYVFGVDTIISTEMLEHDQYWQKSLKAMYKLLKPGGLLLVTAAGVNRAEHGTTRTTPEASPHTTDYYRNITPEMINSVLGGSYIQKKELLIECFNNNKDIGFYLIK